jgi:hypothetical protein
MPFRRIEGTAVKRIVLASILTGLTAGCLAARPAVQTQATAVQTQAPPTRTAAAPSGATLPNEKGSVKFAVIGDTGTGGREQYEVARLLWDAHARFPYEFVLMMGDNMYGGQGPKDFVKKFETPYKPILDAGIKFYATLGNHDDPAQRYYKPFNMDGKRYYTFSKGDVQFFVLDSTYMSPAQLDWLKTELPASKAHWKIAYFHHPLYSSGKTHGSEVDLRTLVEPLFIQYGVNVVFAGHEHFYERVKPQNGIYYFTEGGSAKLREGNIRAGTGLTVKGFDTDNTFMLVEIAKDELYFETFSRQNKLIDSAALARLTPARAAQTQ